jgi:heme/copper-type cytochrome/quinol oxidase subunit 2
MAWTFVHAGPDGQLDTADDIRTVDSLNLQLNRRYHYELHSRDVLHSFSVPAFRLKQDAVPGRAIMGWFQPTVRGALGFDSEAPWFRTRAASPPTARTAPAVPRSRRPAACF